MPTPVVLKCLLWNLWFVNLLEYVCLYFDWKNCSKYNCPFSLFRMLCWVGNTEVFLWLKLKEDYLLFSTQSPCFFTHCTLILNHQHLWIKISTQKLKFNVRNKYLLREHYQFIHASCILTFLKINSMIYLTVNLLKQVWIISSS